MRLGPDLKPPRVICLCEAVAHTCFHSTRFRAGGVAREAVQLSGSSQHIEMPLDPKLLTVPSARVVPGGGRRRRDPAAHHEQEVWGERRNIKKDSSCDAGHALFSPSDSERVMSDWRLTDPHLVDLHVYLNID